MAVDPQARGKGVGVALGVAVIEKARSLGASELYLESNTILEPAINLYRKLGFVEFVGEPSPYERCNIQMVLDLRSPSG
jgi:GNAT superfamily N-acetyltransferase